MGASTGSPGGSQPVPRARSMRSRRSRDTCARTTPTASFPPSARSPHALPTLRPESQQHGGSVRLRRPVRPTGGSAGSADAWPILIVPGLLALGACLALAARALRARSLAPEALVDAQLRELTAALSRVRSWAAGGTTLLALERRLQIVAGSAAAGYAAKLRAARYEPGRRSPPSPAERRALRRELSAGTGVRGRLRGLLAIPPGGPAAIS